MSKKSFAVGTGAMALRPLLADISEGFRFEETTHTNIKTKQKDILYRST
jgi:hypothetical protein